ncbi:MAG: DUF3035 domain-containing protein [Marinosulfonomonas sp.]
MRTAVCKIGLALVLAVSLAACSNKPPRLMAHANGDGPDEFTVLPKKPLEDPKSYAELPVPTPGGSNRTDVNPEVDIALALGGSAAAVTRSGISASDRALIASASRYGVDPTIRATLAAEDLEFRKRNRGRIMYRLAGKDRYFSAYKKQTLDERAEYERWQATGVRTPTAPPPGQ